MPAPPPHLCQSCHCRLNPGDRYCCICGQKRIDHVPTLRELLGDVLSNVFALDTKVLRTMRQLLFVPGSLTTAYIKGERQRYYTPFKLFLFILTILLLLSSLLMSGIQERSDEIRESITIFKYEQTLRSKLEPLLKDSSDHILLDSLLYGEDELARVQQESFFQFDTDTVSVAELYTLPEEELFAKYSSSTFLGELFQHQLIRTARKPGDFQLYLVGHLSWVLFLSIPLLALWLQLLYLRRSSFYLVHLVYTLHLYTFSLVLVALTLTIRILTDYYPPVWLLRAFAILLFGYSWLALRRTYQQSRVRTTAKWFLLILGILFCLALSLIAVLVLNFFLF